MVLLGETGWGILKMLQAMFGLFAAGLPWGDVPGDAARKLFRRNPILRMPGGRERIRFHRSTLHAGSGTMRRGLGALLLAGGLCGTGCFAISWAAGSLAAQPLEDLESQLQRNQLPRPNPPQAAEPGYLGVVTDDRNEGGQGVRVTEVIDGGPAGAAGLKIGDLILMANGGAVRQMDDLARVIERTAEGGQVVFDVLRGRDIARITVRLGRRPAPGERRFEDFGPVEIEGGNAGPREGGGNGGPGNEARPRGVFGISIGAVTREAREQFALGNAQGVLIVEVLPNTPAADAGLRPGDLLLSINGIALISADELAAQLTQLAGQRAGMVVLRGGRPVEILANVPGAAQANPGAAQANADPAEQGNPAVGPRPQPPPTVQRSDAARLEALERRIQDLEAEVRELRQRLNGAAGT